MAVQLQVGKKLAINGITSIMIHMKCIVTELYLYRLIMALPQELIVLIITAIT